MSGSMHEYILLAWFHRYKSNNLSNTFHRVQLIGFWWVSEHLGVLFKRYRYHFDTYVKKISSYRVLLKQECDSCAEPADSCTFSPKGSHILFGAWNSLLVLNESLWLYWSCFHSHCRYEETELNFKSFRFFRVEIDWDLGDEKNGELAWRLSSFEQTDSHNCQRLNKLYSVQ